MKKIVWIGFGIISLIVISYVGYVMLTTTTHSPYAEAKTSFNGTDLSVTYCRPYKNERLIFGDESDGALQPFGQYWRLGANEATQITFSTDVSFAGNPVKAGTYRMYAVPGNSIWEVSLNSELGKWGAYEPNYDLDVLKVKIAPDYFENPVEQFTIDFEPDSTGVLMNFVWDQTKVSIPITQ